MTCRLCVGRGGKSGYVQALADGGWREIPCRCVTAELDHQLYGHPRHRMELLRELAKLR